MRIYTFIMTVCVPSLINTIVNVRIFIHVRSSARRVQPQTITTLTLGTNTQKQKIGRREISLLRQMIFMFTIFIGGWAPVYSIVIISFVQYLDPIITSLAVVLGELSILGIITNLFICNHDLRQYLLNKMRQVFRQ